MSQLEELETGRTRCGKNVSQKRFLDPRCSGSTEIFSPIPEVLLNENLNFRMKTTKDYYDSDDANTFYMKIWGGANIHIGCYPEGYNPDNATIEGIRQASEESVDVLFKGVPNWDKVTRVADLGAGIGGTARSLCDVVDGVHVDCYEISEKENQRNKELVEKKGQSARISIIDKSYTETGAPDNHYDVVLSQDAFLHCPTPELLFKEISRILKPGGYLAFTDPMQTDNADETKLQPIYDRIHLSSMGSPQKVRFITIQTLISVQGSCQQIRFGISPIQRSLRTNGISLFLCEEGLGCQRERSWDF